MTADCASQTTLADDPDISKLGERLTIGTVHTFQGAESDIMVFSPVVAEGVNLRAAEWISKKEELLNVALTRARRCELPDLGLTQSS
jgi:superfamily I DNA and/or RNA helicase